MNCDIARKNRVGNAQLLALAAMVLLTICGAKAARAQYFPDDRNSCRSCHVDARNKTDFCELFEATIYERDDKHGKAFFLLHESDPSDPQKGQAKRDLVRQILGFDMREAFADARYTRLKEPSDEETTRKVDTVKACLRCHATWPAAADVQFPKQAPVALELGVSCQACHGPGLKWNVTHYLPPHAWRVVTPEAKASLGFTDVRSPATKAQLCAGCHVGSMVEKRLVKHEWYAAGHPPLPSFELASFAAQMPMHWKPLAAKQNFTFRDGTLLRDDSGIAPNLRALVDAGIPGEAIKANYLEANLPGAPAAASALPHTKDAIVAGASVLTSYVQLVGDYAALAVDDKAAWPELALYDCAACHHELRSGLAAQSRPKRSHTPGRPPLATWPTALAQLAAQQAAGDDAASARDRWSRIERQLLQLDRATTDRPFGDPAAMRAASQSLAAALRQLANDAALARYDEAAVRKALEVLTDPDRYETRDFYTARQAAWAIREIAKDLGAETERLFFRGAEDPLALSLPSGQTRGVMDNLSRWLPAAAKYDAQWFREELKNVRVMSTPRGGE